MALTHPNEALFGGEKPFPIIPCCEHFAGSEKLITKALGMQDTIGPIFDITCDCEDGAAAGQEVEHAEMIVRVLILIRMSIKWLVLESMTTRIVTGRLTLIFWSLVLVTCSVTSPFRSRPITNNLKK